MAQGATETTMENDAEPRYEDAPFSMFVRFGGGRGGIWFRYKGHVRPVVIFPAVLFFRCWCGEISTNPQKHRGGML